MGTTAIPAAQGAIRIESHPATEHERKLLKTVIPLAIAIGLALVPSPSGLPHYAWYYFCIFVGVIIGLVLEPLPGAAIAVRFVQPATARGAGLSSSKCGSRLGAVRV